jgi:hypothetical protein
VQVTVPGHTEPPGLLPEPADVYSAQGDRTPRSSASCSWRLHPSRCEKGLSNRSHRPFMWDGITIATEVEEKRCGGDHPP